VDGELVKLCLLGRGDAWEELVARQRPLIVTVAYRAGLRGQDVEDMFQSVCVTMLERLSLLQDHRSLASWVATTTARKCWRLRSSEGPRAAAGGEPPADAPLAPEAEFLAAARAQAVRDALTRLPDPCGRLLQLIFAEDLSYAEVARRLGLAVGSIGVYRRRCLNRLRGALQEAGWLPATPPAGAGGTDP
jgi:RNA polymerase sigma factor (sigma-70 family)